MRTEFNQDLILWSVGVLQPTTAKSTLAFISELFPEIKPLPSVGEIDQLFNGWRVSGFVARVHGKSRYFSLTYTGQRELSVALRRYRDQVRLFLLKEARGARFYKSGELVQELVGEPPTAEDSSVLQEGSQPVTSAADPRRPRIYGRSYWPAVSRQQKFQAGSGNCSPDIFLEYFSFSSVKQIHSASKSPAEGNDLSAIDISLAIGISPRLFTSFTHAPENHYRTFYIGKRGGGTRQIDSPRIFLKTVQYWVLDYLLWRLPSHQCCHSYQKEKSIQTNAAPHVGKNYVANVDVENFFGTITTEMIRNLLLKYKFGKQLSKNLSKLLTLKSSLPQGSPASPVLSNSYLYGFDQVIYSAASSQGIDYTRYADDMTLSGDNREQLIHVIDLIKIELSKLGLRLQDEKTRIASKGGQQRVTGVVVNYRISPPRKLRRQIRALFHQAKLHPEDANCKKLSGYASYLNSYDFLRGSAELEKYRTILRKVIKSRKTIMNEVDVKQ